MLGGNLVDATVSISGKKEILFVPVRELWRGSVPDAERCVLGYLWGIQQERVCLASAWKPSPQTHRPRYTQAPVSDRR